MYFIVKGELETLHFHWSESQLSCITSLFQLHYSLRMWQSY